MNPDEVKNQLAKVYSLRQLGILTESQVEEILKQIGGAIMQPETEEEKEAAKKLKAKEARKSAADKHLTEAEKELCSHLRFLLLVVRRQKMKLHTDLHVECPKCDMLAEISK
jgi:hypothetical protein